MQMKTFSIVGSEDSLTFFLVAKFLVDGTALKILLKMGLIWFDQNSGAHAQNKDTNDDGLQNAPIIPNPCGKKKERNWNGNRVSELDKDGN